jgi:DNA polymerase (family 10)
MNSKLIDHMNAIAVEYKRRGDVWRHKTYDNTCSSLSSFNREITSSRDVSHITGIGKSVSFDIDEFIATGSTTRYTKLGCTSAPRKGDDFEYTSALRQLMSIPGVGPVTATGILSGNVKLTRQQEIGMRYQAETSQRISRSTMDEIHSVISSLLPGTYWEMAGSYRRKLDSSGDVDILVRDTDMKTVLYQLRDILEEHITPGATVKYMGILRHRGRHHHIDIRLIDKESWGTALLYFTGSKVFNEAMRLYASGKGYKLNEYGLFKGDVKLLCPTEESVFDELGLVYYAPEER